MYISLFVYICDVIHVYKLLLFITDKNLKSIL